MAKRFTPQASYSELKRVETFIEQALTIEDLRRIAATEGTAVGYRALGRLIAGTMTAAEMKPKEAKAAQLEPITDERVEGTFVALVEAWLTLDGFFPEGKRPYDYQIDGIRFLVKEERALLGDEMGLGKTIQAIGALKILYRLNRIKRALILCPRQLISQWEYELGEWAPELFVQKVRGSQEVREQNWRSGATVHITNYETWRNDIETFTGLNRQFQLVILDEAQKLKQPTAAITTAVKQIKAQYRWGITGTPLENTIDDVITIYDVLRPDLFRNIEKPAQPNLVKRLMKPYFLRRRVADINLDLPEKTVKEVWLELTDEQRQTYETIKDQSRQKLSEPGTNRIHIFAEINKLKQICAYDHQTGSSSKLEYLANALETITVNNQKALVFSQYPQVTLKPIEKVLKPFAPATYDGSLSDKQSVRIVDNFQNKAKPKVLLTSVKSGGIGLNLTRANQVFHFDHWWNPAVSKQAEARAHRIGQDHTVFVHNLFTINTVEERIHHLLKQKEHLFDEVIDNLTEEQIKGALSREELFDLFDLEAPSSPNKRPTEKRSGYRPSASFSDLKRAETALRDAQTVKEIRQIAQRECSVIGYKAFCYLLGELSTPELMKGK